MLFSISSISFWTFLFVLCSEVEKNAQRHLDFDAEDCTIPMQAVEQTIPSMKN